MSLEGYGRAAARALRRLGGNSVSTQSKILNAIFLVVVFIPFSYLTDRLIYRSVQKRQQRDSGR